jgi:tetratricopeptide (TPR) repeat protein
VSYAMLGQIYSSQGDTEHAIKNLSKAVELKPDDHELNSLLGVELTQNGDVDAVDAVIESFETAINIDPNNAEAYNGIGTVLNEKGELDAAIDSYKQALKIKPDYADACFNMGNALKDKGDLDAAVDSYKQALKIKPDFSAAYNNIGFTLKDQGKFEEAIEAYRKALTIKPDHAEANCNMGLALLATQSFHQGFKLQDWRWKTIERRGQFLQSSKPLWNNEQRKSVFVWGEQGIGDEIMFASMIPELHKLSSKIILRCDERLIPLFKRSFPDNIIYYSQGQAVAEDEYDFHIPIGSLSKIFRTSLESFKKTSAGFLNYDREKTCRLRDAILAGEEKKVIGISWKTQSLSPGSGNRNIKLTDLAQILDHANIRLVCLQYGDVDDELKALQRDLGIEIMQVSEVDNMNDIDGLASLIMACDQVVSTTNVTVHLAGALGANTKVLLPFSTRWIWGSSGSDSFWYDTVSPYRQNNAGDWSNVFRALA